MTKKQAINATVEKGLYQRNHSNLKGKHNRKNKGYNLRKNMGYG